MSAASDYYRLVRKAERAEKARRRRRKPKPRLPIPELSSSSVAALVEQLTPIFTLIGHVTLAHANVFKHPDGVTNAEVVADKRNLAALRAELKAVDRLQKGFHFAAELLDAYGSELEDRIDVAKCVNQITKSGVGLQVTDNKGFSGGRETVIAMLGDFNRSAEVIRQPGRGKKCQLILEHYVRVRNTKGHEELEVRRDSYGDNWMYEQAVAEARFWVVGGVAPLEQKWKRDR